MTNRERELEIIAAGVPDIYEQSSEKEICIKTGKLIDRMGYKCVVFMEDGELLKLQYVSMSDEAKRKITKITGIETDLFAFPHKDFNSYNMLRETGQPIIIKDAFELTKELMEIIYGYYPGLSYSYTGGITTIFELIKNTFFSEKIKHAILSSFIVDDRLSACTIVFGSTVTGGEIPAVHLLCQIAGSAMTVKRSENRHKERDIRFRRFFENASEGLFIHGLDGSLIDINKSALRILGCSREETVGLSLGRVFPENSMEDMARGLLDLQKNGEARVITDMVRINGEVFKGEAVSTVVEIGGKLVVLGTIRDISELKKVEAELRRAKHNLEQAQRIAKLGSWEWYVKEGRIWWSEHLYEIYGRDPKLGPPAPRDFLDNVHPEDWEDLRAAVEESAQTGTYQCDYRILRFDNGEYRRLRGRGEVTYDEAGDPEVHYGIVADVTEEYEAARDREKLQMQLLQAQKMESIGILAGGVAHDFNNLLGIIMGSAELAGYESDPDSPMAEELNVIIEAASRAKSLTTKMLTFARKASLDIIPMKVGPVIDNVVEILGRSISKSINIRSSVNGGLVINGDSNQLHQAIMNLCTNSADAMSQGGDLRIEAEHATFSGGVCHICGKDFPGEYCLIKVEDTGFGIGEKELPRVVEPFYTTKGVGKGTGLGLSVTHGIVESHGGHMHIFSERGKGTIVKMYFPLLKRECMVVNAVVGSSLTAGNETVLVVDDEEMLLRMTGRMLEHEGYVPLLATNGEDALKIFRAKKAEISAVVLDLMMPGMDGAELFREIMDIDPKMKVVFASGFSLNANARRMIEEEKKKYIQKPFNLDILCRAIREVLDG